jgi:glucose-1-phosphate cytidylyltransferase
MKVVLFCGGYGMRMRNGSGDSIPKPMQMVGPRPLIWHVMRYYAHFGHTEFVLCLGHGAENIKDYFLSYKETSSNDFVLRGGQVELLTNDISDWSITFAHTGDSSPIGERLRRVRHFVQDDEMFLANYADVLSDAPLDLMIDRVRSTGAAGSMMVVRPQSSFHCVDVDPSGMVSTITPVADLALWENGGYFVLTPEVFEHLPENGDLVEDACRALAKQNRLVAYRHDGFWKPADTFKERAELDAGWAAGVRPWALWQQPVSA